MLNKKAVSAILLIGLFTANFALSRTLEENWNDFLHYTKIGHFELAKGYAHAVLDGNPDPVKLLALSQENPQGYAILQRAQKAKSDAELAELSSQILDIIEQGKFERRSDPKIIVEEIKRLTGTARGRLAAVKRLRNAGEYSIMYLLDAMADSQSEKELANIIWTLPQIGRDATRPLASALQTENIAVKTEIIKAMGKIGYPQSLGHLKYIIENDRSAQLRQLAENSIREIDPAALKLPAAQLFYRLAENYYYHTDSLAPAEDAEFANIWFWDRDNHRLYREKVDSSYFYELMAMRSCENALKADAGFGRAIGLWVGAYFKAESSGIAMPNYFGDGHADATVYATTAGPEYLHQALARAIKDENAYVALGVIETLAITAGEKSLLYRMGIAQPLVQALSFNDKAVKYSAAIAIAKAGPKKTFAESKLVARNLSAAISETAENAGEAMGFWSIEMADSYAIRAARVMLKLAQTQNAVVDLSLAQNALVNATADIRENIQVLAGQILAHLKSPNAQRAITAMALDEVNGMAVRIAAFDSLAMSAKLNASLLDNEMIDIIYLLVSSPQVDPELRKAAAAAYGSLNLPSRKVKTLILDQARS